jgi:hypothetical protein
MASVVGVCVAEMSTTPIPSRTGRGMHLEIAHYKLRLFGPSNFAKTLCIAQTTTLKALIKAPPNLSVPNSERSFASKPRLILFSNLA